MSLLSLCNLTGFLACLFALIVKRRKESRDMGTAVNHVKWLFQGQDELKILFLDYAEPVFKQVDALLSSGTSGRFIVVFHAPAWLLAAKGKKWKGHELVDARTIDFKSKKMIIVTKKSNYDIYEEVVAFMKFMA
ncbi:hypothetical protein BC351_04935 [Paenibacillus ferrarius]|uniref:Uncharacterized protein n=1 Tax=Paenibacillus ferrarius TaxID=1469647 RepID=A0A1V4HL95_9BACL|nr:hypothetical protein BC351_04935 [Paenibacillus ferrarius]